MNVMKGRARNALLALLVTLGLAGGAVVVTAQPAAAASTTCKTITVSQSSVTWSPRMDVAVCYNGTQVWSNGGITTRNTAILYSANVTWKGWYNDSSQHWLGVGENVTLTAGALGVTIISIDCNPRWYINASGGVYNPSPGC